MLDMFQSKKFTMTFLTHIIGVVVAALGGIAASHEVNPSTAQTAATAAAMIGGILTVIVGHASYVKAQGAVDEVKEQVAVAKAENTAVYKGGGPPPEETFATLLKREQAILADPNASADEKSKAAYAIRVINIDVATGVNDKQP